MIIVKNWSGKEVNYGAAVMEMDEELFYEMTNKIPDEWNSDRYYYDVFFRAYCINHEKKFGEKFKFDR